MKGEVGGGVKSALSNSGVGGTTEAPSPRDNIWFQQDQCDSAAVMHKEASNPRQMANRNRTMRV